MRRILTVIFVAASLQTSACSTLRYVEQKQMGFMVGATQLDFTKINKKWTTVKATMSSLGEEPTDKAYLGFVATQSESLCGKFLTGLVVSANGTNTGLDMLTTVFSALGTAFTPLSTVHAMTAGASITSGWKSAVDSDIYAKIAIQNLVQAVQRTYYTDMRSYLQQLSQAKSVLLTTELAKIEAIHGECTLGTAEGYIAGSLSPSHSKPEAAPAVATALISVATRKSGALLSDKLTLTGKSATLGNLGPVTVTVTKGEGAAEISGVLLGKFLTIITARKPTITPALGGTHTVLLHSQVRDAVGWKVALANSASTRSANGVTTVSSTKSGVSVTLSSLSNP